MSENIENQVKGRVAWHVAWEEIYHRLKKLPAGKCFGIPRGGSIVAGLTGNAVDSVNEADYIIDDILDSGVTAKKWEQNTGKKVIAVINKQEEEIKDWVVFPWEFKGEQDIEDTVLRQLEFIGENPNREGLLETPKRIVNSWNKLYNGYHQEPGEILSKTFNQKYDEMVLLKDIELYSMCEHHMLPFYGKCHIAYIPDGKVVGISKLARLMECFSRRLQIQERLCNQIVDAIQENLQPKGSACIIEAKHFCMTSRGIEKQHSTMVTSALRGAFLNKIEAREELTRLIK